MAKKNYKPSRFMALTSHYDKDKADKAVAFIKQNQNPETIISAVVHMDEKTPHMHLSFVPLTEDGRLDKDRNYLRWRYRLAFH